MSVFSPIYKYQLRVGRRAGAEPGVASGGKLRYATRSQQYVGDKIGLAVIAQKRGSSLAQSAL
jgi:hypothetical protein